MYMNCFSEFVLKCYWFMIYLRHVAIHCVFICWCWNFILHACKQIKAIIKRRTKRMGWLCPSSRSDCVLSIARRLWSSKNSRCGPLRPLVHCTVGVYCITRKSELLHCYLNCMYFKWLETALKINKYTLIFFTCTIWKYVQEYNVALYRKKNSRANHLLIVVVIVFGFYLLFKQM